jgi:hypothetical protein
MQIEREVWFSVPEIHDPRPRNEKSAFGEPRARKSRSLRAVALRLHDNLLADLAAYCQTG